MCISLTEWINGLDSGGIRNLISSATALVAIAGLIYQSHATRKQIKLQNFIEYTKRYQEIILNFPEGINRGGFRNQRDKPQAGTRQNNALYASLYRSMF